MAAVSKWCHFELKGQLIKKKKKTQSSKHLLLLSKEERNYYRFGITWWWVKCHFLMNCSFNIAFLCPKKVVDIHLSSHYIHTIYFNVQNLFCGTFKTLSIQTKNSHSDSTYLQHCILFLCTEDFVNSYYGFGGSPVLHPRLTETPEDEKQPWVFQS